jgi:hypothetical protein
VSILIIDAANLVYVRIFYIPRLDVLADDFFNYFGHMIVFPILFVVDKVMIYFAALE